MNENIWEFLAALLFFQVIILSLTVFSLSKEIRIRLKGKVFDGKIVDISSGRKKVIFFVEYEYEGKKLVATLDLLLYSVFYKEGDTIRIVCIPDKNKIVQALLPRRYGRTFFLIFLFYLLSISMWIQFYSLF